MPNTVPLSALEQRDEFITRHIGPSPAEMNAMLDTLDVASLEALIDESLPPSLRLPAPLALPPPRPEAEALETLKAIASRNKINKSLIGLGYHDTFTPKVILRHVLENPGWYTAYTPYQAEVAQGRLEALMNFQHMVNDLTGMEVANASMLDEATAASEAMTMARRISKSPSQRFFVDSRCFAQTIDVLKTRAGFFGYELVFGQPEDVGQHAVFGALFQYPGEGGEVADLTPAIAAARAGGAITIVAADLMALVLLKSPGAMGADIALGSSQRFGIPLGFGGPHAAFFAARQSHVRAMPGRIIGVARDTRGKPAYRMTLQTREQHIRREKANSNLCTSQVLLANMAGLYAVYHGPQGLRRIAERIHRLTGLLAECLRRSGIPLLNSCFFDTLQFELGARALSVYQAALDHGYNLRQTSSGIIGLSLNEKTTGDDVVLLVRLIAGITLNAATLDAFMGEPLQIIPEPLLRIDAILTHPVFQRYHSEHEMLRYLKRLQNRDLALDHAMIPLGSCTMKLNAVSAMLPISWPEFTDLHPFAPIAQAAGHLDMIGQLEDWLQSITGMDAICMQPNSGAQGEYAGIVTIRRYQASRGEAQRNICLVPRSAHGTNPASAQMCGLDIVTVACDENGNVDVADLRAKAEQHAAHLSCLMITYPSTHGVFEAAIMDICAIVHANGGQVYMDGANLNAQVGLTSPGHLGADVAHMNLHKTFAIPHGGGGPGMGPIALKAHLTPFMPNHSVQAVSGPHQGQGAVSAAPWGSASILPIPWMYIAMMGGRGLTQATKVAILNANYVAARLQAHYPVLYTGQQGRVAHECILDIRPLKAATGITETDIAKRLMDYGFHAPTVSFPVGGTLMVEPTESESKAELDRFISALIAIREEIRLVEKGVWPADNNPLKNAPHTQADMVDSLWERPYSRETAAFPLPWIAENKFWPSVNRIDEVYGDRHLKFSLI